jgi:5-methylcytosine-specific restriction endonuclease McrA
VRPEEADRFGEKLQHLLPKAAAPKRSCGRDAGEVITAAWRYALQVIDNTKAENPTKSEEAAVAVTPARKASEVTRSSKDRVKRYRAKRKNWSPENLSIHQAVKARNRSGNHLCYVCGRADTAPHHIIPRSEGGLPLADNIIWLCNPHHEEVEGPYGGPVGAWDRINLAKAEYRAQAA